MDIEIAVQTGERTAALEIETYSSCAEMLYRHSVGLVQLGIMPRRTTTQDLESLSDMQKNVIHINLGSSGNFYVNKGENDKAEYWYSVAEYFRKNFMDIEKRAIGNKKHNPGLVLVKGNSVP